MDNISSDSVFLAPPLIFSGPSGVGKGTLLRRFTEEFKENIEMSISWTTRNPRSNENNGVAYHFKSHAEFDEERKNDGFVEVSESYGNFYGTNKKVIQKIAEKGKICVLEVDVEAGKKIHEIWRNANFIFFNVKDAETLRLRMKNRNTENDIEIEKRLDKGLKEIDEMKKSDIYREFLNEDLASCYDEVIRYIQNLYPKMNWSERQN